MPDNSVACSLKKKIVTPDAQMLAKVRKRLMSKWMSILIFSLLFGFFVWLIISSVQSIWFNYKDYLANRDYIETAKVGDTKEDPKNINFDDEEYDKRAEPQIRRPDNRDIKKKIEGIKNLYQSYNIQLKKEGKDADTVDEKMLSFEYDNY